MSKKYVKAMAVLKPCSKCGALKGQPCQRHGKDIKNLHVGRTYEAADNALNQIVAHIEGGPNDEETYVWWWMLLGLDWRKYPVRLSPQYWEFFFERNPDAVELVLKNDARAEAKTAASDRIEGSRAGNAGQA